jgi:hypothetical protein
VAHPKEGVQSTILHELCEDHDRNTVGDHALQADDVGVFELTHDGGLTQELTPLPLRITTFQGLNGHTTLLLPRGLQSPPAHLTKLTFNKDKKGQLSFTLEWPWLPFCLTCSFSGTHTSSYLHRSLLQS